jgi:general secretion pathway protein F/type IV pilus assembly protein PilC
VIYRYKGLDASGKRTSGKIEAESLDDAKHKLKASGILYERVDEERQGVSLSTLFRSRGQIKPAELARLSRELATYMRSGMTIVNALRIVRSHYKEQKRVYQFLTTISTYLDEGKNFYTALEQQGLIELPEFYKQSIRVSESTGILDEVLIELSRFLEEQARVAKEVRNAFVYPAFMLVVSLFMVTFMLVFVVPQVTAIFAGMDQELPGVTRFVVESSTFLMQHHLALLAVLAAVVAAYMAAYRFSLPFAYLIDRVMLSVPLFGKISLRNELGRFAYVASLLVRSGVPFVQTIDLSANVLGNRVLSRLFASAAGDVVEGKRLSQALAIRNGVVDNAFVQAVALGEESSQVEHVLSNISQLYFDENRDRIRMLLSLLEPVLMLVVGGLIGFIVAAMLLPIFSMSIV